MQNTAATVNHPSHQPLKVCLCHEQMASASYNQCYFFIRYFRIGHYLWRAATTRSTATAGGLVRTNCRKVSLVFCPNTSLATRRLRPNARSNDQSPWPRRARHRPAFHGVHVGKCLSPSQRNQEVSGAASGQSLNASKPIIDPKTKLHVTKESSLWTLFNPIDEAGQGQVNSILSR